MVVHSNRHTQSGHILLIEDNPADARYIQILLEEADFSGFDIVHKTALDEGLHWLHGQNAVAVLLDLSLPDSEGFDTLNTFISTHPNQNVIVMTGHADKQMGLKAVKAGAQDYLVKGEYDVEQLKKSLWYSIERKQNTDLKKARDIALKAEQMKEQLLASVSHEMRTPMNAILGMSNLLSQTLLNEEQREYVTSIKQSSELLLGLINDILEISALKNSKIKFERKAFDIKALLRNLIEVMKYKAQEKSLVFELSIGTSVPQWLLGDALRLNQILFNLVGNAIKFTARGAIRVDVDKISETDGQSVLKFSVIDSGIGIPEDKLDVIFEAFTRLESKDQIYEGTGLGLSISKNLVEQQGGQITAMSSLGEGSTFYFTLPFDITSSHDLRSNDIGKLGTVIEGSTYTILLVEDHKMNQIVAKKTIERKWKNIEVLIAENGREAINILERQPCDLILMDIQMPVMNGYEATKHIRTQMPAPLNDVPILAMTAHVNVEEDSKFRHSGMNGIVLKPFNPDQLYEAILLLLKPVENED